MRTSLVKKLKSGPLSGPARRAYRRLSALTAPLLNRRPSACRVINHGIDNTVLCSVCHLIHGVVITIDGDSNSVSFNPDVNLTGARITIEGNENSVTIGASDLNNLNISLSGNGNCIKVADECTIRSTSFVCEDDGNSISIGASTEVAGSTELVAIEGTHIDIGRGCLFSGGIHFRTGDSHTLLDQQGGRINPSADIIIADHVWVGRSVTVLKGTAVADSSVVGACAVVTKKFGESHCAIAGNPARVIAKGIDWQTERIPYS